jgi:hypothetical protein
MATSIQDEQSLATKIIVQCLHSISQKYDYFNIQEDEKWHYDNLNGKGKGGTVWYSYYYSGGSYLGLFNYCLIGATMTITFRDMKNGTYAEGTTNTEFEMDEPDFKLLADFLRKRADSFFPDRRKEHKDLAQQRVRDVGPKVGFYRRS